MKLKLVAAYFLAILFVLAVPSFEKSFANENIFDSLVDPSEQTFSQKIPIFKKKPKKTTPKMVETVDEWLKEAQSVPLEMRKVPNYKPVVDEKLKHLVPQSKYLASYNSPAGSPDVDLSKIKKSLTARSQGVSSPDFKKLAYTQYYYSPSENQISSEALLLPLNLKETRINRVLNANVLKTNRVNIPQAGMYELRRNLYNAFVIVDWSYDSQTILLKEKVGGSNSATFRTYVWMMFVDPQDGSVTYRKCEELDRTILNYWQSQRNINLNAYRWDITPLGWDAKDRNRAIVLAYAYQKNKTRVFLGAWSIERYSGVVKLLSLTKKEFPINSNGVIVRLDDY